MQKLETVEVKRFELEQLLLFLETVPVVIVGFGDCYIKGVRNVPVVSEHEKILALYIASVLWPAGNESEVTILPSNRVYWYPGTSSKLTYATMCKRLRERPCEDLHVALVRPGALMCFKVTGVVRQSDEEEQGHAQKKEREPFEAGASYLLIVRDSIYKVYPVYPAAMTVYALT